MIIKHTTLPPEKEQTCPKENEVVGDNFFETLYVSSGQIKKSPNNSYFPKNYLDENRGQATVSQDSVVFSRVAKHGTRSRQP